MKPCVATVGTFDGFHIGHRAIINKVAETAREKGLESRGITFINHPLTVVAPEKAPKWALPRSGSVHALEYSLDKVSEMNFTPELASLKAADFMKLIKERFNVAILVMGYDNTFGSDRLSTKDEYERAGHEAGIEVVFVDAVITSDGKPASSSRLRKAVANWDIRLIFELLKSYPMYSGPVEKGKQLGRRIGFPTMNVGLDDDIVAIPDGVYAAEVFLDDEDEGQPAVVSIGSNPTVGGSKRTVEVHVANEKLPNMYGETVFFLLLDKIRDIKKFDSVAELKQAIKADIAKMYKILDEAEIVEEL